nr:hypothetical protein [Tanacetum cinerariifolium]
MASAVICLATGRKFNFSKYIFDSMVRNVDSPSKFLMYPRFLQVIINAQVADLSSHNNQYTSPALTQKVFANMRSVGKGFSRVETSLFATMLVQPQPPAAVEEDDVECYIVPKSCSVGTRQIFSSIGDFQAREEGQEVREEKEIKVFWFKEVKKGRGKIKAIDADVDITLVDAETQVDIDAELQGRIDDAAATKEVNVAEPTMAKRLHDEEVEQAAAREKQEKDDLEKAKGLQQQYDEK